VWQVLYTGDYSREEDRHLMQAEIVKDKPDILIAESTFGTHVHESREAREARFTAAVSAIVRRGGRCLIPVFAVGRAQELLLILEEYWERNAELRASKIPIYYASQLAKKCMKAYVAVPPVPLSLHGPMPTIQSTRCGWAVGVLVCACESRAVFSSDGTRGGGASLRYIGFPNAMNMHIRERMKDPRSNPFHFKHVSELRSAAHLDDSGPSVVLASPGMLQSSTSRELFEMWCTDARNGVIIAGYSVQGTLAKEITTESVDKIDTMGGQKLPLRMSVESISFAAHVDYIQNRDFVRAMQAPKVGSFVPL
jgi:cleavage and polyadenylation specificity factor subunit 3